MTNPHTEWSRIFRGLLLGTAVGDSMGLPSEGMSPRRIRRLWSEEVRHRLLFGRGMTSDDTDHACFTCRALLAAAEDPERFAHSLAWGLRRWSASLAAGMGLATARACGKLWLGFGPDRSGVFSAGNGPAMRSPIIGAFFAQDAEKRLAYVRASTIMTHTDPRALTGAAAVAEAAAWTVVNRGEYSPGPGELREMLLECANREDREWTVAVDGLADALRQGRSVSDLAETLGRGKPGVSGYMYHTVPVAVYAWVRHWGDFRGAISAVIDSGGDTDTVAAITGALVGAVVGEDGIPAEWIDGILDWPNSVSRLRALGDAVATLRSTRRLPPHLIGTGSVAVIPRNLFFLCVVLYHGFRRLLPPY